MLTFITGCMRSGKSDEFWKSYEAITKISPKNPDFFPDVYLPECTYTREMKNPAHAEKIMSISASKLHLVESLSDTKPTGKIIFIEEAQLYADPSDCIKTVDAWLNEGRSVFVAGLRKNRFDFPYNEFTTWLLLNANVIMVKDEAQCDVLGCDEEGYNSAIIEESNRYRYPMDTVDTGDMVKYETYCREHYHDYMRGYAAEEPPPSIDINPDFRRLARERFDWDDLELERHIRLIEEGRYGAREKESIVLSQLGEIALDVEELKEELLDMPSWDTMGKTECDLHKFALLVRLRKSFIDTLEGKEET